MTASEGEPRAAPASLEAVFAAIRSGDIGAARSLATVALGQGVEHPVLLNLRALDHEDAGRFGEALADLRRAHFLAPRDFAILNACGLCLARMDQPQEALRCFDQVLEIQPKFGPAWFNRGAALERLGETAEADRSYARATDLNPESAQGWANQAFLAARRGDREGARAHATRALALQERLPTAELALAAVDEPAAAEVRLRALLDQTLTVYDRGLALGQLGDCLDAQDRCAEAFAAYDQSNRLFRAEFADRFEGPGQATAADTLRWLETWAQKLDPARWPRSPAISAKATEARDHVFLLGFPRSGTTLIENVLAGHPAVATLEERNTLDGAVREFLRDPAAIQRLEQASQWSLQPYRDDYWTRVKNHGVEAAGKVFIDKNPFNTLKLPLIQRLFPDAKIIFALRDPRDVVLSCFRRRFNLNASTYEFLDLKRAAANYDQTLRFADLTRAKLGLGDFPLVYERLVEDFAAQAQAVFAFLGLEAPADALHFGDRARRGEVASASSAQIARGLFTEGAGQWRRYRAELAPVLETLAPWVERFGYPAD